MSDYGYMYGFFIQLFRHPPNCTRLIAVLISCNALFHCCVVIDWPWPNQKLLGMSDPDIPQNVDIRHYPVYCKNSLDDTGTIIIIKQSETQTTSLPDISPSGICLKSWLIIIWVWPILFCSTEAPAINWWAKRVCKEWKVETSRLWVEWWAKACKLCLFGILSECNTALKFSACHDCKLHDCELHTASGKWRSNVFLTLAKFAVLRPKTRWVRH